MDIIDLKIGDKDILTGSIIQRLIAKTNDYIVFIDTKNEIHLSLNGTFKGSKNFGKIINQVTFWESICNKVFGNIDSLEFKSLLAEAYARMLEEGNNISAQEIIDTTVERINKHGKEVLRQNYIYSSLITTSIIVLIIGCCVIFKGIITNFVSYEIYRIFLMGLFGGIGAFVSTMIRVKNYEAEITLGKNVHRLDGFLRIVYGLFAGIIVSLGIKSNIIFGFVKDATQNSFVELFIGIIGGASEIILPNIIKKVEEKV